MIPGTLVRVHRAFRGWHVRPLDLRLEGAVAERVVLADARFVIDPELRRQQLATGARTLHAWVEGTLVELDGDDVAGERTPLRYHPQHDETFVRLPEETPIWHAPRVVFTADGRCYHEVTDEDVVARSA